MSSFAALRWTDIVADDGSSTADEIRAFLDGETNGEPLLRALYDHILDEPIPARLLQLLRG
jgi:hypothetical protein